MITFTVGQRVRILPHADVIDSLKGQTAKVTEIIPGVKHSVVILTQHGLSGNVDPDWLEPIEKTKSDSDILAEIRQRDGEAFLNGRFLLDMEVCDEDGSPCPTGGISWMADDTNEDPEALAHLYDIDAQDATIFVDAINDRRTLLLMIQRLLGDKAAK